MGDVFSNEWIEKSYDAIFWGMISKIKTARHEWIIIRIKQSKGELGKERNERRLKKQDKGQIDFSWV